MAARLALSIANFSSLVALYATWTWLKGFSGLFCRVRKRSGDAYLELFVKSVLVLSKSETRTLFFEFRKLALLVRLEG